MIGLPDFLHDHIETFTNPDGSLNCKINGRTLHSRKASLEISRLIHDLKPADHEYVLLIGAGSGQLFTELAALGEELTRRILIYEPFHGLRAHHNKLPQCAKLRYFADKNECLAVLKDLGAEFKIRVMILPALLRLKPEISKPVKKTDPTIQKYRRQWSKNYFQSLNQKELPFVTLPATGSVPVLYCGAGPSLFSEYKEIISRTNKNYYIIASDSAAYPLLRNGYRVDCIACVDASPATWLHFARKLSRPYPVFLTWLAGPPYLNRLGRVLYYLSDYPADQILYNRLKENNTGIELISNPGRDVTGLIRSMAAAMKWDLTEAGTGNRTMPGRSHVQDSAYQYYGRQMHHRLLTASTYLTNLEIRLKNNRPHELYPAQDSADYKTESQVSKQKPFEIQVVDGKDFYDYLTKEYKTIHAGLNDEDKKTFADAMTLPRYLQV